MQSVVADLLDNFLETRRGDVDWQKESADDYGYEEYSELEADIKQLIEKLRK
jgi:hypothetical protein